jgi:hypothetical protein
VDEYEAADVVALRFDEPAVAADLARWCGGQVEGAVIWVPGLDHPKAARRGDWIVMNSDGTFSPCSPEEFAARYEPLP